MLYFNNLPIVSYNEDSIRDIFKKIVLLTELNKDWLIYYRMNDKETLHDIAFKVYGDMNYWWLLAIINNIKDYHFDANIDNEILQTLAKDLQKLQLTTNKDFLLFPKSVNVSATISGEIVSGSVIDKYIEDNKYFVNVRLDDINKKFDQSVLLTVNSDIINKITMDDFGLYESGDLVRQDFVTVDNSYEGFARGRVILKDDFDLYIYKTTDSNFEITGATVSVNNNDCLVSSLVPVNKPLDSSLYSNILTVDVVNEFKIQNDTEYIVNYLNRFEYLENINNTNSLIKIIKKDFLNNIQNLILSQLD